MRWVSKFYYHDGEGLGRTNFHLMCYRSLTLLGANLQLIAFNESQGCVVLTQSSLWNAHDFASTDFLRIRLSGYWFASLICHTRYADVARRSIETCSRWITGKVESRDWVEAIKDGRAVKTIEFMFREAAQGKLNLDDGATDHMYLCIKRCFNYDAWRIWNLKRLKGTKGGSVEM